MWALRYHRPHDIPVLCSPVKIPALEEISTVRALLTLMLTQQGCVYPTGCWNYISARAVTLEQTPQVGKFNEFRSLYMRSYVYVRMCATTYVLTHICSIYQRIYMYVCVYVCMFLCMYVRTYVCVYIRTYVCMYVYIYIYIYLFIYLFIYAGTLVFYICVYICECVYTYVFTYFSMYIRTYALYVHIRVYSYKGGKLNMYSLLNSSFKIYRSKNALSVCSYILRETRYL
jgi:hypothetical protein